MTATQATQMTSEPRNCLYCNESEAAIRASQRRGDPIYCGEVDYFGEVLWENNHHRFREWTDWELRGWRIKPEYYDLYRRIMSGWEILDEHRLASSTVQKQ